MLARLSSARARRRSRSPPRALFRLHAPIDEVADLAGAAFRIENLRIETVPPGKIETVRLLLQGGKVGDVGHGVFRGLAKLFLHENFDPPSQDHSQFPEAELGMVLHPPEHTSMLADFRR